MANITINIAVKDGKESALLKEYAISKGWRETVTDNGEEVENPITPQRFIDDIFSEDFKKSIISKRSEDAAKEAVEAQDNSDVENK